ncbi:protein-L-isoaspartate O-methyltransferase family protein [Chachezhania antarctica]|uniref:protein-L-isoaspartate O-methyltransferase family protein n=1 Tax=Chachezhania antarctica TaxID=2340860 RepID=UPI000EAB5E10|nr:protein-L-isoaspartate O-methyltransferase [Chachezhania antarctica]
MTDFASRRRMMVDTQVRPSDVTQFPIIDAMLAVPREAFVPNAAREAAYAGENIPLGLSRVLMEPRTIAKMLEMLTLGPGDMALDIGCGYGYTAAIMARLADVVVAVEEDESLAADAPGILTDNNVDNVIVHTGPLAEGAAEHKPYDAILIEGGVEAVPAAVLDQLKDGGRIVALFVEGALGSVRFGLKRGSHVSWRYEFNAFAPVLPGFAAERAFAL